MQYIILRDRFMLQDPTSCLQEHVLFYRAIHHLNLRALKLKILYVNDD